MWPASGASPSEMSSIAVADRGEQPSLLDAERRAQKPTVSERGSGAAQRARDDEQVAGTRACAARDALRPAERRDAEQHAVGSGRVAAAHGDAGLVQPFVELDDVLDGGISRQPERDDQGERLGAGGGQVADVHRGGAEAEVAPREQVEAEMDALDERVLRDHQPVDRPPRRARSRTRGRAARARRAARTRPAPPASQQLDPRPFVERVRIERGERVVQPHVEAARPGGARGRVLGGHAERRRAPPPPPPAAPPASRRGSTRSARTTCSRYRSPLRAARVRSRRRAPARRRRRGRPARSPTRPGRASTPPRAPAPTPPCPSPSTRRRAPPRSAPTSVATSPAFPRSTVTSTRSRIRCAVAVR